MPQIAERLRKAGLKATAPRRALLMALDADRTHPTAEQLFARLRRDHPGLSLSTVYHGLDAFARTGLCRRFKTGAGVLRVDGRMDEHDHAVCMGCGALFDVDAAHFPRPPLPVSLPQGLQVNQVRVEYEVTCSACESQQS